jgi:hypothetical protein
VDPKLRIVTQLPLRGLWQEAGPIAAAPRQPLSSSAIRNLLLHGSVQFVVVDVGRQPRWIALKDCYRFWMDEVQHHLADPGSVTTSAQPAGVYSYHAFEWQSEQIEAPIVVLEVSR